MLYSICPRIRSPWVGVAAAFAALFATSAHAAFHLWTVQEVYSDNSGALQFIELYTPETGQNFVNGQIVKVTKGVQIHTFTVPGSELPGDTTGHTLLFGTAGLQAAGGPAPDYIIPNGFLFTAGGNLNFFNAVFAGYPALPTDGTLSFDPISNTTGPNSPENYAGQMGFVTPVPEPTSSALIGFGATAMLAARRRGCLIR